MRAQAVWASQTDPPGIFLFRGLRLKAPYNSRGEGRGGPPVFLGSGRNPLGSPALSVRWRSSPITFYLGHHLRKSPIPVLLKSYAALLFLAGCLLRRSIGANGTCRGGARARGRNLSTMALIKDYPSRINS